ncbi:LysR family transcriptional regulator [Mesorhizobium sp. B3-1-3]|uniref:LysR family transcriptional regulator n=1 Tax=unclassified Mesorhizobium TaxID=325217 RepID=UPI001129B56F|nr:MULTISPECIES: LysR family transcriptional regulator [unclassified Mesorhizobium]TPI65598.1 LysR family transcriptional regulator [Mesorhizobium sp. B3-1-3]TPI67223.1 LysR family transcriptional regulator [Mesorhizobium sp. B3-1-8]
MRPTFIQLEAFFWTARLGSLKEAARHLHVAPPTVSLRIDQLEAEVGGLLFERAGRGLALTPKGQALVPGVAAVIDEYGRVRQVMGGKGLDFGILRVGTTETFALACLSAFMKEIERRYPGLELEFVVRTSADLELGLLERRLDIVFAINPSGDPKLTLIPLGIQPAIWVATPDFGLPSRLHPTHLHGITIITNPHPAPMWRQITDWFRQAGLEPSRVCRCSSPTVAAQLVKGGRGVSLLPRLLVQSAIDANEICGMDTDLPVHPSRMFAAYRFAEGNSFLQEIINLGHDVMLETKLIEKIVY